MVTDLLAVSCLVLVLRKRKKVALIKLVLFLYLFILFDKRNAVQKCTETLTSLAITWEVLAAWI